jgi:hypothetical protein
VQEPTVQLQLQELVVPELVQVDQGVLEIQMEELVQQAVEMALLEVLKEQDVAAADVEEQVEEQPVWH